MVNERKTRKFFLVKVIFVKYFPREIYPLYSILSFHSPFVYKGGRGDWSVSGCTTHVVNISYVSCVCNHLTSFACLVVSEVLYA